MLKAPRSLDDLAVEVVSMSRVGISTLKQAGPGRLRPRRTASTSLVGTSTLKDPHLWEIAAGPPVSTSLSGTSTWGEELRQRMIAQAQSQLSCSGRLR